jgi:hypothetical protein
MISHLFKEIIFPWMELNPNENHEDCRTIVTVADAIFPLIPWIFRRYGGKLSKYDWERLILFACKYNANKFIKTCLDHRYDHNKRLFTILYQPRYLDKTFHVTADMATAMDMIHSPHGNLPIIIDTITTDSNIRNDHFYPIVFQCTVILRKLWNIGDITHFIGPNYSTSGIMPTKTMCNRFKKDLCDTIARDGNCFRLVSTFVRYAMNMVEKTYLYRKVLKKTFRWVLTQGYEKFNTDIIRALVLHKAVTLYDDVNDLCPMILNSQIRCGRFDMLYETERIFGDFSIEISCMVQSLLKQIIIYENTDDDFEVAVFRAWDIVMKSKDMTQYILPFLLEAVRRNMCYAQLMYKKWLAIPERFNPEQFCSLYKIDDVRYVASLAYVSPRDSFIWFITEVLGLTHGKSWTLSPEISTKIRTYIITHSQLDENLKILITQKFNLH